MKYVLVFILLCTSLIAIDLDKQMFDKLELEEMSLVEAVDRINKIHSNKADGQPEVIILLDDPLNMKDSVSLSLNQVNLKLLLDVLLSGTNYKYVIAGNYIVIQKNNGSSLEKRPADDNDVYFDSVCLIEVETSSATKLSTASWGNSGSGFLCEFNGAKFLVTNIHVIEAANSLNDITVKTRDNVRVELTTGYVAQDRDLCIFRLEENSKLKFLKVSKDITTLQRNDPIYLLGYPLGGGVLRRSDGSLDGIGSKLVEINCSAFSGNSGGPVFDAISNEAIGVLTKAEIVSNDKFTELARKKLNSPITEDIRIYATRLDSVEKSMWEPIIWSVWEHEKELIYKHMNSLLAIASLVDSNYTPGTLITNETDLIRDPDIWRAYKKCAEDHEVALKNRNAALQDQSLLNFINYIEQYFRPEKGSRWRELSQGFRYEWFTSSKSGNEAGYDKVEDIKKLYRIYHNDWLNMSKRWDLK